MSGLIDGAYDKRQKSVSVETAQKWFRDNFNGQSAIDPNVWDVSTGSGMTVAITAGILTVTTGTDINSETTLTSKDAFLIPTRLYAALRVPTRIANQEFYLELVSVDEQTGAADNKSSAGWRFAGAVATTADFGTMDRYVGSYVPGTVATTATLSVFEVEAGPDEVWFYQRGIDSTLSRNAGFVRHRDIPDPNKRYKIRLRVKNLAVAPASSTTIEFYFAAANSYTALSAEITASRGGASAGAAMPVTLVSALPTVITTPIPSASIGVALTANIVALATTNATLVKAAAGSVCHAFVSNSSASWRYLKLFNKATAPVPGTDAVYAVIPIAPNSVQLVELPISLRFTLGIGLAITALPALLDATAVGADEVVVSLGYV